MMWFLALVVVLIIGASAVVAAGWGGGMTAARADRPEVGLPADRDLTAQDLQDVRFSVGLRGYRMDEVDALLSRLMVQLEGTQRHAGDDS